MSACEDAWRASLRNFAVSTRALQLAYGSTRILRGFGLSLARGQTLAHLSPRVWHDHIIAAGGGLAGASSGEVMIEGQSVAGDRGTIVEHGNAKDIPVSPQEARTKAFIAAVVG